MEGKRLLPTVNSWEYGNGTRLARTLLKNMGDAGMVFQKGRILVRLEEANGRILIQAMSKDAFRAEADETSIYLVQVRDEEEHSIIAKPAPVPNYVVDRAFGIRKYDLQELEGVMTHPSVNKDGEYLIKTGFDLVSGNYLSIPEEMTEALADIAELEPSGEDMRAAIATLDDLYCDFPFEDEASRANLIAFMLTLLCRPMIEGLVPITFIQAHVSNNGKSLLARVSMKAIMGEAISALTLNFFDDAEVEKKLFAELMSGSECLFIDDIKPTCVVQSSFLQSCITSKRVSSRLLGATKTVPVYCGMPFIMTGTNPKLVDDIKTRSQFVVLRQEQYDMDDRVFRHPKLEQEVIRLDNRIKIIRALFILVRNWEVGGKRPGDKALGRFDEWARTIGGILQAADINGFLENKARMRDITNEEEERVLNYLINWYETHKDKAVSITDTKPAAIKAGLIAADQTTQSAGSALGKIVRRYVGKLWAGGYRLSQGEKEKGLSTWKVERQEASR
jgi:hypothetical protein